MPPPLTLVSKGGLGSIGAKLWNFGSFVLEEQLTIGRRFIAG
ncbi:hypothetical protein Desti_5256 [Desulfomonile tiedjei DSM 6799]|uniref:Uncharacterized protein n=1 Tax=Desulfomonile tiedjei (strain ATCC 49306 / DSM 6799 / DCB-1) TaxID=706587 RepID=I4CE55_DESTA|nr:hypothetical protein Desti_5256 [Desulfomonile tiedjei DSM 6799]